MPRAATDSRLTAAGSVAFVCLWLFVFSFPAEKSIEVPGLGTISKLLGGLALAAGLLAVLIDRRIRKPNAAYGALALFVLWTAATFHWTISPEETVSRVQTNLQLLGMAWLIWEFCPTQDLCLSLMRAYVFGTFYAAAGTVSRFLLAQQTYYQRYAADGFEPNDMALTLALSIPFSYYLAVRTKGARAWIYWVQLAITFLTVLLSASRTGFLACCLASLIAPLTFRYLSGRQRGVLAAAFAVSAIGGLALIPATSWKRLSTIGAEVRSGSLNSRSMIWNAGLATFREHPVAGIGVAAYPRGVEPLLGYPKGWRIVAHNSFLSVLVETGMVGFILFLGFLAFLVAAIWRMPGFERTVWGMAMLIWTVGVSTLTWEMRKPTWLLFALILAMARALSQPVIRTVAPRSRPAGAQLLREVVVP